MRLAPGSPSSRAWRIAALVAVVLNTAWSYASERLAFGVGSMSEVSDRYHTLVTPAGWAFSIWGAIYASFFAYVLATFRRGERDRLAHDRVLRPLVLANVLAAAWVLVFRLGQLPLSVVVMAAIVATAIVMYRRVSFALEARALGTRWWTVPFALFLGWISVAAVANVAATFAWMGVSPVAPPAPAIAMVAIVAVAVLGLTLAVVARDAVVPAVIAWATAAIWSEQQLAAPDVAWVAVVVATVTLAAAIGTSLGRQVDRRLHPPNASWR